MDTLYLMFNAEDKPMSFLVPAVPPVVIRIHHIRGCEA